MRASLCLAAVALLGLSAPASIATTTARGAAAIPHAQTTGGPNDFDFEIGTWTTRLSRLVKPLSGSKAWVHYEGTSVVRPVWGGRANLLELDVTGPAGRIEALSLRLYNPQTRQWAIYYATSAAGTITEPVFGGFVNGRGEFYGQDVVNGRAVFVRFVITPAGKDTWRFEQAFSEDGGRTWENNWIAVDTRKSTP